jgi:tetratricopeptide (TPR) repeat protein
MLDEAIKTLEAALTRKPDDAKAQFLAGRAYEYRGGEGDDARVDAAYAKAAELAPADAEYQFRHGQRLAGAGKTKPALAAFRKAAELDPKHAKATLMVGAMFADAGDDDAALEWFNRAAAIDERYAAAYGNIGQIHQNRGRHKEALAAFEKALSLAPADWRYRAKLIQLHQALGNADDRDRERKALVEMWHDDKVDQPLFCREQFDSAGRKVQAYEFFELRGDRAVRYSFVVMKPGGKEPEYRITLGSYAATNEIARENGTIKKGERLFHLDGYFAGNEHKTFGMFKAEPTYEATRVRVVEAISGKLKPVSGSKPAEDGRNLEIEVELE